MTLTFTVIGTPAPQGSKRHVGNGVMIESSKLVKPWRQDVATAARIAAMRDDFRVLDGPLRLAVVFRLPKPASLSKAKTALGPCRKPDLSKLIRATEDALVTAGVIADDARIVSFDGTRKVFAEPGQPTGATIEIAELGPTGRVILDVVKSAVGGA